MKTLQALLVAAVLSALPLSMAHATSRSLGAIVADTPPTGFAFTTPTGVFQDFLNFTTLGTGLGAGVNSVTFDIPGFPAPAYASTGLSLALFSGADGSGSLLATGAPTTLTFVGPLSGVLSLRVDGTGTGSQGGAYGGFLSVTSAVPLPAALPLMGAGLAALGLLRARQRRKEAA